MLAVGVGIEIASTVAKALTVAAGVFEVIGHLAFALFLHDCQRVEEGHSRVALGRGGQVQGGVGQRKAPLGQADAVEGFSRGDDDLEGALVGEADVLAGEDEHAAEEKARIFASVHHPRQPVEGGVWIRAAHGLDKGADGVEVVVALLVVEQGAPLDGLLGYC